MSRIAKGLRCYSVILLVFGYLTYSFMLHFSFVFKSLNLLLFHAYFSKILAVIKSSIISLIISHSKEILNCTFTPQQTSNKSCLKGTLFLRLKKAHLSFSNCLLNCRHSVRMESCFFWIDASKKVLQCIFEITSQYFFFHVLHKEDEKANGFLFFRDKTIHQSAYHTGCLALKKLLQRNC